MKSLFYSMITILTLSCHKSDILGVDELPPYSSTGINTFGCLINNEVFISKVYNGGWTGAKSLDIQLYKDSVIRVKIIAKQENKDNDNFDQKIVMSISNFKGIGTYKLEDSLVYPSYVYPTYYEPANNLFNSTRHHLKQNIDQQITIKYFDEHKKVISGLFSFTVIGMDGSFSITDGRFDGKYED